MAEEADPIATQHSRSSKVKKLQLKKEMKSLQAMRKRGVVYIGHIPHGFYETQMRDYFSQFGTVKRLRLARSTKTGGSKGYAFVEFEDKEVAEIVADTMNNYLMFNKLLKCCVVPPERLHPRMFQRPKHMMKSLAHWREMMRNQFNRQTRTLHQHHKRVQRLITREKKTKKTLEDLGIEYDFPEYVSLCILVVCNYTIVHVCKWMAPCVT
jgi:nucleolar protein 15